MSLENSSKSYATTKNTKKLNEKTKRMKMKAASMCKNKDTSEMMRIPEITTEELLIAINRLTKGKSADRNGISAEDIKACDNETGEMVRHIFNEILKLNALTPETWRKVTIKVIHKKGGVEDVGNYRPICSLPALYSS